MVDVRSDRPDSPGEGSCQSISRDRDYGYHGKDDDEANREMDEGEGHHRKMAGTIV